MKKGNCQNYEEWSLRKSGAIVLDTLQLQKYVCVALVALYIVTFR
jgi:hypothetical protein